MKKTASIIYLSVICWIMLSSFVIDDLLSITRIDPYTKVFPENVIFRELKGAVEIASGEHAIFQYVINSPIAIKNLSLSCEFLENERGDRISDIKTGFVGYVGVGTPADQRPHDALSSSTGLYPDPILDLPSYNVPCGQAQAMWITISTDKNTKPGTYKGELIIQGEIGDSDFKIKKEMPVQVYPIIMKEPSFCMLNWHHDTPDKLKIFNNGQSIDMHSEEYWSFIETLTEKMKGSYQNIALIDLWQHIKFSEERGRYSFDFSAFDEMVGTFDKSGIRKIIVGSHFGSRAENSWTSPFALKVPETENGKMTVHYYPLDNAKVQNFYTQFIPFLMKYLKEKKLDDVYYQHIADEPIDENADSYIKIAQFIKSLAPDIKIIEACQSAKLADVIDIWVPIINSYQSNYDFFKEQQKKGKQVWFYTCCFPRGEYANRFIEWPLVKTRLIYWIAFNYGATGYLHWGFNYWTDKPYEETTVVDSYGTILPAGDSFVVYPDYHGGLNSSIRLEVTRNGIEDYTLLKMLEEVNPEKAHSLCKTIVKGWDSYNTNSDFFCKIRHEILTELSEQKNNP